MTSIFISPNDFMENHVRAINPPAYRRALRLPNQYSASAPIGTLPKYIEKFADGTVFIHLVTYEGELSGYLVLE